MNINYIVFYFSAVSFFFDACKSAKAFSKRAGVIILGVIEEKTLSQNFILSLF